jgi:hypothetical protein
MRVEIEMPTRTVNFTSLSNVKAVALRFNKIVSLAIVTRQGHDICL